jgi:hypothetical protein
MSKVERQRSRIDHLCGYSFRIHEGMLEFNNALMTKRSARAAVLPKDWTYLWPDVFNLKCVADGCEREPLWNSEQHAGFDALA